MKESITKFDLESAFKALDEIDIPKAGKVKANKPALTEIFSRKTKFDALMEEYYDISSTEGLNDAQEAREAEVAKAKLARIEKIVDLDADSPEDLLTSYVGKYIMQCPQCMTLFYKNQEDIVEAEDDPNTVNVNEVCQHCGNESGYTLVGKVGEATPEDNFDADALDMPAEDIPVEETPAEGAEEIPMEEPMEDADLGDLDAINLDLDAEEEGTEPTEDEEKKEESFAVHTGEALVEDLAEDADLDAKLKAHNEYIEYLRAVIEQEETKLEKENNEQIKAAIQKNIDTFKADLESALPEAVKNMEVSSEEPVEEIPAIDEPVEVEDNEKSEEEPVVEALTEALHEDTDSDVSESEFKELIDSPEFKKPISDSEVRAILATDTEEAPVKESFDNDTIECHCSVCGHSEWIPKEDFDGMCPNCKDHHGGWYKVEDDEEDIDNIISDMEEIEESLLENLISHSLIKAYKNVIGFKLNECIYENNTLSVNGDIQFASGKTRNTTYSFTNGTNDDAGKILLKGLNEKLGLDKKFTITGHISNRTFISESFNCNK